MSQVETKTINIMDNVPIVKKTVVIIPLYGYWKDLPVEQLNYETLQKFTEGLRFKDRYIKYIYVGERSRLPSDILNLFITKSVDGATTFLNVPEFSLYSEYLQSGLEMALEDDSNEFIVFANPWTYLGWSTVDDLINRLNLTDYSMVCGWDKREDGISAEDFVKMEKYNSIDRVGISRDLFGFNRMIGGMVNFDENYKTPYFVLSDLWGQIHVAGQESLKSGNLPYYSFDVDFSLIEPQENFEEDKSYFVKKWGFSPEDIKYK